MINRPQGCLRCSCTTYWNFFDSVYEVPSIKQRLIVPCCPVSGTKWCHYFQMEVKAESRFLWNENPDKNVKFLVVSQYMGIFQGLCLCNEEHRGSGKWIMFCSLLNSVCVTTVRQIFGRWVKASWFTISSYMYIVIPYDNDFFFRNK